MVNDTGGCFISKTNHRKSLRLTDDKNMYLLEDMVFENSLYYPYKNLFSVYFANFPTNKKQEGQCGLSLSHRKQEQILLKGS